MDRQMTSRKKKYIKQSQEFMYQPFMFELVDDATSLNKSSLPLTDSRNAVPHAHRVVHS